MDFIVTETVGHVLKIGLNRPEKMNAFTMQMMAELSEAYTLLDKNKELRCGLLYTTSENFTSGLDLAEVTPHVQAGEPLFPTTKIDPLRLTGDELSKPMILAVQGYCLTIGLELLLAADICIATPLTKFGQIEVQRGIFPFGGATFRMRQRAGWGNAMRHLLTGDIFDGNEAYRIGLVAELNENPMSRGFDLATIISEQAPLGVQATLQNSRLALIDEKEAKQNLTPTAIELMQSKDAGEGLQSFIERRKAKFTGE